MKHRVVAVIPAFNEARTIAAVLDGVLDAVGYAIVVDDGSLDGTAALASLDGTVPVVRHPQRRGVGAALRTGIAEALSMRPEVILTLDADGQHNPEEAPSLLEPILSGRADLVVGARDFSKMPVPRQASNLVTARILRGFGVHLPDVQCGFRAIRREALERLQIEEDGYPWAAEQLIRAQRLGVQMGSVEIETIRGDKSGVKPLRDTIRFLRMIWGQAYAG
ncbi:MAG: glycosyltransferase family 2 protein [Candidatus Bathyarchaeia archaeon]